MTPKEAARQFQQRFFDHVKEIQGSDYDSEVADSTGISRSLYSQMKNGHKPMSINSMLRISRTLGLHVRIQVSEHSKSK